MFALRAIIDHFDIEQISVGIALLDAIGVILQDRARNGEQRTHIKEDRRSQAKFARAGAQRNLQFSARQIVVTAANGIIAHRNTAGENPGRADIYRAASLLTADLPRLAP